MTTDACFHGNVLEELLDLLKLEKIEANIFRGRSQDLGFGAVFGGQVLGQALSAASQTVPEGRWAHSLHAYFLRPGDATRPIVYEVDCIRDGKSFTTRRVKAIQYGQPILNLSASFQVDEPGFDHQRAVPPDVPGPDGIVSEGVLAQQVADKIPAGIREKILCPKPIEIRPVNPLNPFAPEKMPPLRYVWFRAIDTMPDDPAAHQYMLAYASDFGLVATALYPHGTATSNRTCRWRAWITPCGFTGRFAWTRGCSTSPKAPARKRPGGSISATSTPGTGCWWPRWPRRG